MNNIKLKKDGILQISAEQDHCVDSALYSSRRRVNWFPIISAWLTTAICQSFCLLSNQNALLPTVADFEVNWQNIISSPLHHYVKFLLWDLTRKGQWELHVYSVANFVASWLKWLQMILNEFKWLQLIY